jgi:hypothetical protein
MTRQQPILNFSVSTSRLTSLLASLTFLCFFFVVSVLSPSRFTSWAKTSNWCVEFNISPTWFFWTWLMTYYKAKLKSSGDKSSPCFRPFWIRRLSDKHLPTRILLYILFKHILVMGAPNSMRMLCNTFLLIESWAFLNSVNSWWITVPLYKVVQIWPGLILFWKP